MNGKRRRLESLGSILKSWGILPRRPRADKDAPRDGVQILLPKNGDSSVLVGELVREGGEFVFRYSPDYVAAEMSPLRPFPSFNRSYHSKVLWPFFAVRIPSHKRPEVREIIERERIDVNDQIRLLQRLGTRTVSNPFVLRPLEVRAG